MLIPVSWLLRLGLSDKVARILSVLIPVVLVLLALLWLRADAYSDGEKAADVRWKKAIAKAEREAVKAAQTADEKQAVRQANFAEEVKVEKEKIDAAVAAGGSPFDVMFPTAP